MQGGSATPGAAQHVISHRPYSAGDIAAVVAGRPRLALDPATAGRIDRAAWVVAAKAASDEHVYGVNTGVGALCETRVPPERTAELQRNIILSHACAVGPTAPEDVCRTALFLKLLTFRHGVSGIRLSTVERMIDLWNAGVIPATPSKGSLGASGDLAPLAHMALPLMGLGTAYHEGRLVAGAEALRAAGMEAVELAPKEGLSLINGVQFSAAMGLIALGRARDLRAAASVVAALSTQAFSAASTFYDARYHRTTAHAGQRLVAAELSWLLDAGNHAALPTCNQSHQDPYSFRCTPQVHGACDDAIAYAVGALEAEANSPGDNPLVVDDDPGTVLYGGNLHGEPCALATDFAALAVAELASISERRSFQLLAGERGLPDFLVPGAGLHTGYMIAQYTAASLLNEIRVLATPASIDNAMTSQLQEDHVSMAATSASKLLAIVDNAVHIVAVELLLAVQAAELNPPLRLSPATQAVADAFREAVPPLGGDRLVHDDLVDAAAFLQARMPEWRSTLDGLRAG